MKVIRVVIFAVIGVAAISLRAQEAAEPFVDLSAKKNRENPPPAAAISPQPDVPELSQLDEIFKQTSLGKEADERRLHIEWRQLANQVMNEPEVVAARNAAETTRTDLEKRQRLRAYYEIYFGRMRALATSPEMKAVLDQLKSGHQGQTSQPRVRPETDAGLPGPTPAEKKKRKHGME